MNVYVLLRRYSAQGSEWSEVVAVFESKYTAQRILDYRKDFAACDFSYELLEYELLTKASPYCADRVNIAQRKGTT